jgi:hypothetical protein
VARIGVPVAGGFLHLVVPLEGPSEMQETEVRTHDRGAARHLRIEVDGRDVLSSFREMPDGSRLGLLTGLSVGPHTIVARANGSGKGSPPGRTARLDVVNHPITGPLFSGPQQQPFFCETVQAGLDPPTDADCSARSAGQAAGHLLRWRVRLDQAGSRHAAAPRHLARLRHVTALASQMPASS